MPKGPPSEPVERADEPTELVPFRKADREQAFSQLIAFSGRAEFRASVEAAQDIFSGDHRNLAWDDATASMGFATWYVFDFKVRGRTLCERFLDARATGLTPAERRYLQRMRDTRMGLYEILNVRVDQGLTLVDQVTAEHLEISEKLLTGQASVFDVVAARVTLGPKSALELDGAVYLFKQRDIAPMLLLLQAAHASGTLKEVAGAAINRYYIESRLLRPFPKILSPEGHETMPSRVLFKVDASARAKLAADGRFDANEDGSFTWLESARSSRILGTAVFEDGRLVLETMTRERADKGLRLLKKLLAGSATFERLESESLAAALERTPKESPESRPGEAEIPLALQAQILDQYYATHYRAWLDESIPALDGKTPRRAAREPAMRSRLVALIKEIESDLGGQRLTGETTYSASWMFRELALESAPARGGADASFPVHRLKISLRGVKPPVWRRIEIASAAKLPQVSRAILGAMGWTDTHLHMFLVGKRSYGVLDRDFPSDVLSERNVTLAQIVPRAKNRFDYEYDFGNGWSHAVTVEAIVEAEPGASYPRCVAGARACPPEDCGGPHGYADLVSNLADPSHPDHVAHLQWDDSPFDPESFSLDDANMLLRPSPRKRAARQEG